MPCRSAKIAQAVDALTSGEVIAYPTEAVWGLGCDPFNNTAVDKILALKSRPVHKGLIVVAADIKQFDFILKHLSSEQLEQLRERWPGPVTWLVPHFGAVPHWISGDSDAVALRVSAHPLVQELCSAFGPIVSTSANPQGLQPARDLLRVKRYFGNRVRPIPGVLGKQKNPSEIRDLITGSIVRPS